jgi:streptogramin lyase
VTIFKHDHAPRSGRPDSRKFKRNRLLWTAASDLLRLEPRTMLSLTVTTFQIPLVAIVEPQGITTGSDGNLWFTEYGAGKIGRMTPSGAVSSFALPAVPPPAGSPAGTAATTPNPTAITAGPDGALWFTGIPGEIGRITTAGVVGEFALPAIPPPSGSKPGTASTLATATAITAGPDGALWFTGLRGDIGRITTTGVVTEFAVPDILPPAGSAPGTAATLATLTAIAVGPDGALWFTGVPGEVGRMTTAGVVTEFSVPSIPPPAGSAPGTAATPATLVGIAAGPDNALWFTGVPGEIGRITTAGVVTEFAIPAAPTPIGPPLQGGGYAGQLPLITQGPGGDVWFTMAENRPYVDIGQVTPAGTVRLFNVSGNFNAITGLTAGPGGNVWFTEQEDGVTSGEQPAIGEVGPTGVTTLHAIPQGTTLNPDLGVEIFAEAIATGEDGAVWFTEGDAIARMSADGTIQAFPLAQRSATPENIMSGPDNRMWFTQHVMDESGDDLWSVGLITAEGAMTVYPLSPEATVKGITEERDGSLWVAEEVADPNTGDDSLAIGRITPQGAITTFPIRLGKTNPDDINASELTAIAIGPDGNVWFTGDYIPAKGDTQQSFVGRITARGQVRLFELPSSVSASSSFYPYDSSYPDDVSSMISGPGGKLWFAATEHGTSGIAQISTDGKLGRFIPAGLLGNLVAGSDGRVWFPGDNPISPLFDQLAIATRSGTVVTQSLPAQNDRYGDNTMSMTAGQSGSLWLIMGTSAADPTILRVSAPETPAGGLDYRHRPRRTPDYVTSDDQTGNHWTNVTSTPHPTFAGVAKPGAELTLWAQKQGENSQMSLGQVKASKTDGSWILTSRIKLSNGNYAVTATENGDTGPPSVLYSLVPDASGDLSNALVIQSPHGGKRKA